MEENLTVSGEHKIQYTYDMWHIIELLYVMQEIQAWNLHLSLDTLKNRQEDQRGEQ